MDRLLGCIRRRTSIGDGIPHPQLHPGFPFWTVHPGVRKETRNGADARTVPEHLGSVERGSTGVEVEREANGLRPRCTWPRGTGGKEVRCHGGKDGRVVRPEGPVVAVWMRPASYERRSDLPLLATDWKTGRSRARPRSSTIPMACSRPSGGFVSPSMAFLVRVFAGGWIVGVRAWTWGANGSLPVSTMLGDPFRLWRRGMEDASVHSPPLT
eukprot:scaffold1997_cov318-Pavlova_lutheri.AAC.14